MEGVETVGQNVLIKPFCNLAKTRCKPFQSLSQTSALCFSSFQGRHWGCPHYAGTILSIIVKQKNRALCWNNSVKFLSLFVFYKNFAKTMGFPYKTPAQVPHFKTGPGYNLAKTWLPPCSSSILELFPFTLVSNINLSFVVFYLLCLC